LEQKTTISVAGWSNVTNVVNVMSGENQVTIPALKANAFYRLVYP
jgi:hypothetical protein